LGRIRKGLRLEEVGDVSDVATEPRGTPTEPWQTTACILCSVNCGVEIRLGENGNDGARHIERVRGDKSHPLSQGYTCEKALRLDHYQNGAHRLTTPMRRRDDGTFEAVDWDTAIREVAQRLAAVRDEHGGDRIFYYGGGGQGNHLGGGYGSALQNALGVRYRSNALAQEKTGEFWVDGQLFGATKCHTTGDYEHAQVAMFVGKNPWQSHGFPRARTVLKEIARDPNRHLIVIDPRRTETADLADLHLQVRPGTDAWCLSAMLAVLVEEDLVAHDFLAARAVGVDELVAHLGKIPIAAYCEIAGVAEADVRAAARLVAGADGAAIYEDLGIQQAPHSTLNSYLEKLLYLLTGNFGRRGGMNIHTYLVNLIGGAPEGRSPVLGARTINGLVPGAVIAEEILTDHPDRYRAMIIESGNPVHSLPDSPRFREALRSLEFVLVVDVAMTETALVADYVLPAASQYEKWEATFFTLEFPENMFHLRRPILEPRAGTLPEPEIHARLCRALGVYSDDDLADLRAAAAAGRAEYGAKFFAELGAKPNLATVVPIALYETLGPALGAGNEGAAAVWGLCQLAFLNFGDSIRRAGYESGDELFDALLAHPEGVVFTIDEPSVTFERIVHADGLVHVVIPELLDELGQLGDGPESDARFPFVLSAGERRSGTANTIFRDPTWRKKDAAGALRMHPQDAADVGVGEGASVRITTERGSAVAVVELTESLLRGHITLPNGLGVADADGVVHGVAPNELTTSTHRDWLAGTPHHKHVPARVEALV
jgi:formate dehydrogenase